MNELRESKWWENHDKLKRILDRGDDIKSDTKIYNWYLNQRRKARANKLEHIYIDVLNRLGLDLKTVPTKFKVDIMTLKGYLEAGLPLSEIDGLGQFYANLKSNFKRNQLSQSKQEFMAQANFTLRTDRDLETIADAMNETVGGLAGLQFIYHFFLCGDYAPESMYGCQPIDELIHYMWDCYDTEVVEKLDNEAITLYKKLNKIERLKVMIKLFDRNIEPVMVGTEETEGDIWYMIAGACEEEPEDGCFLSDLYDLAGLDYWQKYDTTIF